MSDDPPLLRGKENNKMRLGICSRSGDIIEPYLTPQWLVYIHTHTHTHTIVIHLHPHTHTHTHTHIHPHRYVNCEGMAKEALDAVREGELKILPAMHEVTWYRWLENIR